MSARARPRAPAWKAASGDTGPARMMRGPAAARLQGVSAAPHACKEELEALVRHYHLFKGRSGDGSVLEVRRDRSGELVVEVDGQVVERLEGHGVSITENHAAVFWLDGTEFREVFDANRSALGALRNFCASGGTRLGSTPRRCWQTGWWTSTSR